jgi:hypothetical protein
VTDADVAGPLGRWDDTVERQLERLEARLIAEFCGGPISERTVREHLAATRENYVGARVWTYLPILIERDARHRLQNQPPPAAPGGDRVGVHAVCNELFCSTPHLTSVATKR